jgi:dipeptidyl aminopeptidase/acylaminoacyl peptidase
MEESLQVSRTDRPQSEKTMSFPIHTARALCALCLTAATAVALANDVPAAWTPEAMMSVRPIQTVAVSPDGKRVAFVTSDAVMTADKSEYVSQIHLSNGDTPARRITFAEKSSTQPRFSHDGTRLALLSPRGGKNQIYVMPLDGGESEAITDMKGDISNFQWSPDDKSFAFTMLDVKTDEEEKKAKGKDDARFFEENVPQGRLYVVTLAKDKGGKRTPKKLTAAARHVTSFDFAPDSRTIVYAHVLSPKVNHWTTSDVSIVEIESGEIRSLASTPAAESQPQFSPDGKSIAMVVSSNPPTWLGNDRIGIIATGGGTLALLPATYDMRPQLHGFSADGRSVIYSEARGTSSAVYVQPIAGGTATMMQQANAYADAYSLNPANTHVGFAMQSSTEPLEAFVTTVSNYAPRRVSNINADLPKLPLPKIDLIQWKSDDGLDIEGLLVYPIGYAPGKKVPLLLNVHGGPAGVFSQRFSAGRSNYPVAALAAKGFAILQPNPRGSTGYGMKFRHANYKDWGGGDYRDLMRGVDRVIEMGVADANKLGVMGWSYGGFMSSWIITQTDRFKAASIGAAVTNLMSFNGTTDIPNFAPDYFGGQSWEVPETYAKFGAMNHIGKAKTPSLIQHNEGDLRVPISQGYELFNALKQRGIEARMLVVPRQGHGPTEPKALLKLMQTNVDWFVEKLKP